MISRFIKIESLLKNKCIFLSANLVVFTLESVLAGWMVVFLLTWEERHHWISTVCAWQIEISMLLFVFPACLILMIVKFLDSYHEGNYSLMWIASFLVILTAIIPELYEWINLDFTPSLRNTPCTGLLIFNGIYLPLFFNFIIWIIKIKV